MELTGLKFQIATFYSQNRWVKGRGGVHGKGTYMYVHETLLLTIEKI